MNVTIKKDRAVRVGRRPRLVRRVELEIPFGAKIVVIDPAAMYRLPYPMDAVIPAGRRQGVLGSTNAVMGVGAMNWHVIAELQSGRRVKVRVNAGSKCAAEYRAGHKARSVHGEAVSYIISARRA